MPAAREVPWEQPDRCDSRPLFLRVQATLLAESDRSPNGGLSPARL